MRKSYLQGWPDVQLTYDNFETDVSKTLSMLDVDPRHKTNLIKMMKKAFFAGREQIIDELNTSREHQPDTLKLKLCQCGHTSCTRVSFTNAGSFYQGSGFDIAEANRLAIGWDLAGPDGDRSVKVTSRIDADGLVSVLDIEDIEAAL